MHDRHESDHKGGLRSALFRRPAARISWISAAFLLIYTGAEVAIGGWIVTFMLQLRDGEAFASGMTATGFWLGMTVGRAVLGFVTPRFGVKMCISVRFKHLSPQPQYLRWRSHLNTADIHRRRHRPPAPFLARPELLRLRRRRRLPGLLPRAAIPRRGPRRQQPPAPTPACRRHRFHSGVRRVWGRDTSVRGWCSGAGVGRAGFAAGYSIFPRGSHCAVAFAAEGGEEGRVI